MANNNREQPAFSTRKAVSASLLLATFIIFCVSLNSNYLQLEETLSNVKTRADVVNSKLTRGVETLALKCSARKFNYLPWNQQNDEMLQPFLLRGFPTTQDTTPTAPTRLFPNMILNVSGGDIDKSSSPYAILHGPTLFSINNITLIPECNTYLMTLPPIMDPGLYQMHIIFYDETREKHPRAIPGSPFIVRAGGDSGEVDKCDDKSEADAANHDAWKIESPLCDDAYTSSQESGRWIQTPAETREQGLATRSGWVWFPFSCQFGFQPIWKLPCVAKPCWIMIMGTSTTRGLFFSTLDLLLGEDHVQDMMLEKMW